MDQVGTGMQANAVSPQVWRETRTRGYGPGAWEEGPAYGPSTEEKKVHLNGVLKDRRDST